MKHNKKASQKRTSEGKDSSSENEPAKNSRLIDLINESQTLPDYPDEPDTTPPEPEPGPQVKGKRLRQVHYIECYIATGGNLAASCKLSKVSRVQAWRWFKDEWFQKQINDRMQEWELLLRAKMFQMAMNGNTTMLIFLSKFLNPFYDDVFRTKILTGEMAQSLYERYPIPNPQFLPPEIPERFRVTSPVDGASAEREQTVSSTLVHNGGNQ